MNDPVTEEAVKTFERTRKSIHDWPYPEVNNAYKAGDYTWHEVDKEIYDNQFGNLFPLRMGDGGFMTSEPSFWDPKEKQSTYSVYMKIDGRYFCKMDVPKHYSPATYRAEIRKQFDIKEEPDA